MHPPSGSRKRHAVDPPLFDTPDKRRRPNLAHGFQGLSLSSTAPFLPFPPPNDTNVDEDDFGHSTLDDTDVSVEEVDTPSSPSSVGTADSDATFRDTRPIRRKKQTLHPDSIEQPEEPGLVSVQEDMDVQDITTRPKKRRDEDFEEAELQYKKRRRTEDVDVDMDQRWRKREERWMR